MIKLAQMLDWDSSRKCMRLLIQGQHVLITKISPKNLSFYIPLYKPCPSSKNVFIRTMKQHQERYTALVHLLVLHACRHYSTECLQHSVSVWND